MLKSITKKIRDRSTDRFFQFSFYCDRCGKEWTSDPYRFEHGFSRELSKDEERARSMLWCGYHAAAFERANLEARLRFSQCDTCGSNVCDDCIAMEESAEKCLSCAKKENEQNT